MGRVRFRWVVLGLATLMQLGVSLPQQTPAAIGPILTHALGLTHAQLGLLTSAIWGGMLVGMLPAGLLADRFGERWIVLGGGAILACFMLLAARQTSFAPVFLCLVAAAVGAAAGSPGGTRAVAAWFESGRQGMAMGIRQTGVTMAGVVTAVLLPPIALAFGWPAAFATVGVLAIVSVAVFAAFYREPAGHRGLAGEPFRLRQLFASRPWLFATAFGWIFMGALGCAVGYTAAALHESAGLSLAAAGLMVAVLQLGGIAGRVGWGVLSDQVGSRGAVMRLAGGLAVVACVAAAVTIRPSSSAALLALVVFVLGAATMGWNALYIAIAADIGSRHGAATAVGAGTTITFTGMFAATPVFGLIADRTGTFTWSWLALAAFCGAGTLLALGIRDRGFRPA